MQASKYFSVIGITAIRASFRALKQHIGSASTANLSTLYSLINPVSFGLHYQHYRREMYELRREPRLVVNPFSKVTSHGIFTKPKQETPFWRFMSTGMLCRVQWYTVNWLVEQSNKSAWPWGWRSWVRNVGNYFTSRRGVTSLKTWTFKTVSPVSALWIYREMSPC